MEASKRCGNCAYFPFCEKIENKISYCDFWQKRERGLKLESKDGEKFIFKKI